MATRTSNPHPANRNSTPSVRTLRILMLHGYTQSGPLFRAKTRALEKSLNKHLPNTAISLVYPTAPLRIAPTDIPGVTPDAAEEVREEAYGWWRRRDRSTSETADGGTGDVRNGSERGFTYEGMYEGLETVSECLRNEGPFDGVVGFSQGGALAGMVASLLEEGRREAFVKCKAQGGMGWPWSFSMDAGSGSAEGAGSRDGSSEPESVSIHPPMRFAASYSGFAPRPLPDLYRAFYTPKIATPLLHFLGEVDTVVEESRSMALVQACVAERVVRHPGGHFLPASSKECVAALVGLVREVMPWGDESRVGNGGNKAINRMSKGVSRGKGGNEEERAEDMNVPF